jgi:DNA-binding GntR family transcriptional regulator
MLNTKSLREQVYEYLRDEISNRKFLPGATININEISQQLGISKTPLRDAVIHLEIEGFVTILPRWSVTVKKLTLQEIKDSYEIPLFHHSMRLTNRMAVKSTVILSEA